MLLICVILVCLATSALAQQQLPPPPADFSLNVCREQRARFIFDSEQASAYATQFLAEIADLKKKLAEAEAKVPKNVEPEAKDK